jgi:hypothetical protein
MLVLAAAANSQSGPPDQDAMNRDRRQASRLTSA